MGTDAIEGTGSINPFIKGLFSGKAIATQAHPKSEDMIIVAQQPVKPMCAPSTWHKGTVRHMPASSTGSSGAGAPCVVGEFHAALDTLFNTLSEMQTWYIFCINPNDAHLPNQLEGCAVKVQLEVKILGLGTLTVQAPLVGWGSSFHHEYEDEVNEDKSMWSNDFNYHSCLTSNWDNSNSNYGTELYAPSRNMFQAADKEGHIPKEALPGENLEGEMTKVVRETSARRRWVLLCWLLT
ncbi:hypothetical protein SCLCIDRAFT_1221015 [Scleroderma citrinum Foug A]|uniref:Myosin motor domain-containing protein n=1 Tax=Scleroderma citrinum Foug A TaxID=1036808 RepID=A0A0C3D4C5_9AGAM|nr:hypothetical protein SCLCIDRAFT_1221015 [Scleroderma citrinum Foug A]